MHPAIAQFLLDNAKMGMHGMGKASSPHAFAKHGCGQISFGFRTEFLKVNAAPNGPSCQRPGASRAEIQHWTPPHKGDPAHATPPSSAAAPAPNCAPETTEPATTEPNRAASTRHRGQVTLRASQFWAQSSWKVWPAAQGSWTTSCTMCGKLAPNLKTWRRAA